MNLQNVYLSSKNTNFNNIKQGDYCYRTWKDLKYSKKNIIPSNSRPLINNTLTTNCSIQSNIYNNISLNTESPIDRYKASRHPSATRTKCGIDKNGNPNYKEGSYIKPKPNPIKHWRKQLFPNQGLIPGILNNIENVNPLGIFGAFMQGTNPDCMGVTLPTRNSNNVIGKKTGYLTVNDVKNLSPCLFSNKINPVTKKTASCIEGFESKVKNEDKNEDENLEILDYLFPERETTVLNPSDIIAYLYFISLTSLFLSLIKKSK